MATKVIFNRLVCKCDKCNHVWIVKPKHNEEAMPRDCPKCRSIKWNQMFQINEKGGEQEQ